MTHGGLATRQGCRLEPDASRVITQLFVPGHSDHSIGEGRATGVVAHILELDEAALGELLTDIVGRVGGRHRDILATFGYHADRIANRLHPSVQLSHERRLVLGAAFTQEYAVEGAALCNPSMVVHPDQAGVPAGAVRFAMTVRQIGEGHRSSIGFRTGLIDSRGLVVVDERSPFATTATIEPSLHDARAFRAVARMHHDAEATAWVLDGLAERFSTAELDARLADLEAQYDTRQHVSATARRLRELATRSYAARFPVGTPLDEQVLFPAVPIESNGMEDARLVRFVDDGGGVTYYGAYTAFDGHQLAQQLLSTTDFATFTAAPLLGAAADNKGLALFPRCVGGRYAAMSRHDGANNAIAFTDDLQVWPSATPFDEPSEVWESVQVGNCGSPIETDEGWLVLTHGVGPVRTYSMGAWLLDLEDPRRVIRRLRTPLLSPLPSQQDGYVPNVVYSCGALLHDGIVVVPHGIGDASIGFATVALEDLLGEMS